MTHAMHSRNAMQNPSMRASRGLGAWLRRWRIGAVAAMGLACTGTASADSLALMSGAGQSGLGGGPAQQPLVVEVRDVNGAVVAGRTIDWTTSNGFVLSAPSSVTDANGLASVNFTYGNYGTTAIVAFDPVGENSASAPETSVGSDSITVVSGDNQAGKSGSASAQPIVVQVLSASGNPVVGRTVNWADQTAFTQVNAPSSVTDASGDASMGFTYLAATVSASGNAATIRATNSAAPSEFVDAAMTVVGFDNLAFLSGATQSGFVGATSAPIVAQVTDTNGNPVQGVTVSWSQTSGPAGSVALSSNSTVTDASGKASITFQYLLPNSGAITAQTAVTSSLDMHFAGTSAASLTLVSSDNLSGAPSSVSPTPIVVKATNPDGTPAVGHTINWTTVVGDGMTSAPSSITNASGQASVGFTYGTVSSDFQASDPTIPRPVIEHTNVTPTDTLRIVSGQNQIGTINHPAAQPIVVQVLNSAGAPVIGRTINWSINSGSSVSLNASSSVTDATGSASVGFTYLAQAGSSVVQAQDPTTVSVFINETATGLYAVSAVSGNNQSGLVGTHSAQPLVMQELDPSGNPVVGRTINWSSGGNATLDGATSVTNASGRASMGFTYGPTASISPITASDPLTVGNNTGSVDFTVASVGANSISIISGNGQAGLPSAAGAQPLVVEVRNSAGQTVAGRTIQWTRTSGDVVASAPSSATDASGRASMTFTYGVTSNNTSTLAATDAVSGQQVEFTMTTGKIEDTFRLVSGDGQTGLPGAAGTQPIVIEVLDPNNVPVAGKSVVWSVVSGPATLATVTNVTDASGQAHANFNFGPAPGTSIIQATGPGPNQPLVQATVTTLVGGSQTLSIVSGNGQLLVGGTASAPLVVQLRNASNAPVVGATISWTATNGNLPVANSITDAAGRASNTVTATTTSGAVTVQANSALASAPVTFNLSTGLSNIPGLTPPEQAVAGALDNTCPALAALAAVSSLTPAQADLLARCNDLAAAAGIDPTAAANGLGQLVNETAAVQSEAAVNAATAQFQNITLRLNALRSSSKTDSLASNTSSFSGLAFAGPGGVLPIGSLVGSLFGDGDKQAASKQAGADFSRWGFFATGTIGRGKADARSMTPAYNYDINGLTAGVDYRQRDNWISGVALGYSRQNTDLLNDAGHVSMNGWSLSTYSTLSFKNDLYLDGVLTWGSNSFDLTRRIQYTLPLPGGGTTSIDQLATGRPGGSLFSAAVTFGGDFHKQAWNFSPYAQLISSRMGFDGYQETLQAGPGMGLGLAVDSRSISTFSSVLGAKVSHTNSMSWGVLIPTASLEWQHAFNSDQNAITARFINDPTQTRFSLIGNPLENSFVRLGLGSSFVMSHGRSGFVLYEHTFGRNGMRQDNLGLGIRIEF